MIVASILLILVAVVLLVLGLAEGSSGLLVVSIAASLLAAVALVVGARQAAAVRAASGAESFPRGRGAGDRPASAATGPGIPAQHVPSTVETGDSGWRQPPGSPVTGPPGSPAVAPGEDPSAVSADPVGVGDDEPAAQLVTTTEVARLANLPVEVVVVDGRPRFHLASCPHLVGRAQEALPVAEAVELGFTPCAHCAPATALLADAGRS
ncbi:hypothetical protein GA0070616_0899 [Micromonospora nigra]|uniref:Uncharacterized protein n=1 Tax=Micromonospora nigra TaxID=145857 RepID=A0A1C6RG05_9ACTN|nr:hypothetical protein [Micromonospora nigra]SCL16006.1 hypothetical protein GA0070616_0899 [Micromonospora nigra]